MELLSEAELEVLLGLGPHKLLQLLLWPGELPLYLVQGSVHPAVEVLCGRDGDTVTAPFSEVEEVLLLQLFDGQNVKVSAAKEKPTSTARVLGQNWPCSRPQSISRLLCTPCSLIAARSSRL